MYVTPRTLLGIIRLSQALSKLRFSNTVSQADVDESIKLMDFSISSLNKQFQKDGKKTEKTAKRQDKMSSIIQEIRNICSSTESQSCYISDIYKTFEGGKIGTKATRMEIDECLNYYQKLSVIYCDAKAKTAIFL